ncbi:hypothetical protein FOA52_011567 [Chlamydomonas sp. UWO 241]|nr:hypothetical protein FOA52_011567 [Chlamydomonas sp. UWO 241]
MDARPLITTFQDGSPLTQTELVTLLRAHKVQMKNLAEVCAFGEPPHDQLTASLSLSLKAVQQDVMCALAGCSDVCQELGRVKPQVYMAVYEMFRVNRAEFAAFFKASKVDRRRGKRPAKAADSKGLQAKRTQIKSCSSGGGSLTPRAGSFACGRAGDWAAALHSVGSFELADNSAVVSASNNASARHALREQLRACSSSGETSVQRVLSSGQVACTSLPEQCQRQLSSSEQLSVLLGTSGVMDAQALVLALQGRGAHSEATSTGMNTGVLEHASSGAFNQLSHQLRVLSTQHPAQQPSHGCNALCALSISKVTPGHNKTPHAQLSPRSSSGTDLLSHGESLDYVRQQREALEACLRSHSVPALLARPTNNTTGASAQWSPEPAHYRQANDSNNGDGGGLLRNNTSAGHGAAMPQRHLHVSCDTSGGGPHDLRAASMPSHGHPRLGGMAIEGGSRMHPFGNTQVLRQQGILELCGGHTVKELGQLRTTRVGPSLTHPQSNPFFLNLPVSNVPRMTAEEPRAMMLVAQQHQQLNQQLHQQHQQHQQQQPHQQQQQQQHEQHQHQQHQQHQYQQQQQQQQQQQHQQHQHQHQQQPIMMARSQMDLLASVGLAGASLAAPPAVAAPQPQQWMSSAQQQQAWLSDVEVTPASAMHSHAYQHLQAMQAEQEDAGRLLRAVAASGAAAVGYGHHTTAANASVIDRQTHNHPNPSSESVSAENAQIVSSVGTLLGGGRPRGSSGHAAHPGGGDSGRPSSSSSAGHCNVGHVPPQPWDPVDPSTLDEEMDLMEQLLGECCPEMDLI